MCRREFEIDVSRENFHKDFKVALDICSPIDEISSDKSGVMNGAARTSEDSARRNPLDEQHIMARLVQQNPLRSDFQRHYKGIVAEYNREKDRVTIEKTFEPLLEIIGDMDDEECRTVREGLDDESLAVFDLLRKPNLTSGDIKRIKAVAVDLLETLKVEKLRINHWRDKESTRDAVRMTIQDYLWSEQTGLPETYSEEDVRDKTEAVFVDVFRAYPTVPSPYCASMAS